ncbi:MAG: DUF1614 domain-containing protein [Chloroflexota bacterium]
MPGCLAIFVVLLLLASLLFGLVYFQAITLSFHRLGLSPTGAMLLFAASLIGSLVNIPVSRRPVLIEPANHHLFRFFFYFPPRVEQQVIAVNVGGAVVPVLFSLYLLPGAPVLPTLVATAVVTAVAKMLARPVPAVGITLPGFIPPLVAVGMALLLAHDEAPRVAYISGTLGVLIGADLLNLPALRTMPALMLSIGGAGVFDGIFLVGILAVLLT